MAKSKTSPINRRLFLKTGVATAAGALVPSLVTSAWASAPFEQKLFAALSKASKSKPHIRRQQFEGVVSEFFDAQYFTRKILSHSKNHRNRVLVGKATEIFHQYLASNLETHFGGNQNLQFAAVTKLQQGNSYNIKTAVQSGNLAGQNVAFTVRPTRTGAHKAYDYEVSGMSILKTTVAHAAQLMRQSGGDVNQMLGAFADQS